MHLSREGPPLIVFLVTRKHAYTLADVLAATAAGGPRVAAMSYERALTAPALPPATYVFTDLDRLTRQGLDRAAACHHRLRRAGMRALNDPARFLDRLQLLQALHAAGINPFTAWRATPELVPPRWPVFVRRIHGHQGPLSGLVHDPEHLHREIAAAVAAGCPPDDLIVVEYCAEPLPCGFFCKFSVFRFGDVAFAEACVFDDGWVAKRGELRFDRPDLDAGELRVVRENPHGQAMAQVFALAGIEYGRVDFGMVGGRPAIYEINTNPHIELADPAATPVQQETLRVVGRNYLAALARLDRAG
ncbi:hypothetical protein STVA_25930 [Allostella vacuolata]|nr:hypothetical protein STVA_25930 [Stella vacuolata]